MFVYLHVYTCTYMYLFALNIIWLRLSSLHTVSLPISLFYVHSCTHTPSTCWKGSLQESMGYITFDYFSGVQCVLFTPHLNNLCNSRHRQWNNDVLVIINSMHSAMARTTKWLCQDCMCNSKELQPISTPQQRNIHTHTNRYEYPFTLFLLE